MISQKEMRHIDLTVYGTCGIPGQFTAMAQTVGTPLAIAAKLVLSGEGGEGGKGGREGGREEREGGEGRRES